MNKISVIPLNIIKFLFKFASFVVLQSSFIIYFSIFNRMVWDYDIIVLWTDTILQKLVGYYNENLKLKITTKYIIPTK